MADISSQLKDIIQRINTAVRGEDVRDAIIEAINLLKTGDGNAYSLNGHPASHFATQDDMDKILPMDATPTQYSQRPVSSGGIYELLEDMLYVIDQYINKESVSGTITDRLAYLDETRRLIRNEIIAKNVSVDKNDTFRSYADKIKSIETHSEINVSSVEITESNLEYDSTKHEYTGEFDPGDNNAYKPVTVTIKPSLSELTITKNGEYKASDQNIVGFSSVKVDISEESGSSDLTTKKITSEDLPDDPGEVTFKAKDEQKIGYSQVSVDVSGKFQEKSLEIDPTSYGEQQVYEAKDDGLYGWSKVTVTLVESEGPFTVKFYDGSNLKQTVSNVPKGGRANYTGPKLEKAGETFSGWNPSPDVVTHDMSCYAVFKPKTNPVSIDGEITKSWSDIAANGGADIPIGAFKILYSKGYTYDGQSYPGFSIPMVKVYAGEAGSTSTWMSYCDFPQFLRMYLNKITAQKEANGWPNSDLRTFLNGALLSALRGATDEIYAGSADIANAIKSVEKYTQIYDPNTSSYISNAPTQDYIWIPCARELSESGAFATNNFYESTSPIYSASVFYTGTQSSSRGMKEIPALTDKYTRSKYYHDIDAWTVRTVSHKRSGSSIRNRSDQIFSFFGYSYDTKYYMYRYKSDGDPNSYGGNPLSFQIGFCT